MNKSKKVIQNNVSSGGGNMVYFFGLIGALIYYRAAGKYILGRVYGRFKGIGVACICSIRTPQILPNLIKFK